MKIFNFFDKLEDKIRHALSRRPIIYATIGAICIVLFWRGIWMLADEYDLSSWASIIISVIVLLATGIFTSFFIGEEILISGMKQEKKITEKTEEEVREEEIGLKEIKNRLEDLKKQIESINKKFNKNAK